MDELTRDIADAAAQAVAMCTSRGGGTLDYSEASLVRVEEMLAEAADFVPGMTPEQVTSLVQDFGC